MMGAWGTGGEVGLGQLGLKFPRGTQGAGEASPWTACVPRFSPKRKLIVSLQIDQPWLLSLWSPVAATLTHPCPLAKVSRLGQRESGGQKQRKTERKRDRDRYRDKDRDIETEIERQRETEISRYSG